MSTTPARVAEAATVVAITSIELKICADRVREVDVLLAELIDGAREKLVIAAGYAERKYGVSA